MSKENNESRFNQGAGKLRSPLKNLADKEIPNIKNNMKQPNHQGQDVYAPKDIPVKKGVNVNKLGETPTKPSQEGITPMGETPYKNTAIVNKPNETPEKSTANVNLPNPTPEKSTIEPNTKIDKTPEKDGKDVNLSNSTPEKQGKDVELFDNSSQLENHGRDVSPFSTISNKENEGIDIIYDKLDFSSIENISPIYNNDKTTPFNKTNLSTAENLSPIYSNDVLQQSFEDNKKYPEGYNTDIGGIQGGIDDTAAGSLPPHPEWHSQLDDLPGEGIPYTPVNNYESVVNQNPLGVLVNKTIDYNKTGQASNPLVQKHWDDIGNPLSADSQEVNFMSGINSYFQNIDPAIPGFNRKNPLLNSLITQGDSWGEGVSRSHLGNLFAIRVPESGNFTDGENNTTEEVFDFRQPRPNTPSHTNAGIININTYGGSVYDDIRPFQLYNFSGLDSPLLQTAFINGIPDNVAPELNDGLGEDGYNESYYDPRYFEANIPTHTFGTPLPNTYRGTRFDDPLNPDLVNGGGLFNDSDNLYSNIFRENSHSFRAIATAGSATTPIGQGYISSQNALLNYDQTGGVLVHDFQESGSLVDGYQYTPGDIPTYQDSNAEHGINLSNGSWFYTGNQLFPNTNNYLDPSWLWHGAPTPGTQDSPTRTVSINGVALTGQQLGYGDLTFDSLYDSTNGYPIGIYDERLDIRWGSKDLGGGTKHPIRVYDVPEDDTRIPHSNKYKVYVGDPKDRTIGWYGEDITRISDWLDTNAGRTFVANQQNLWFKNRIHWDSPENTWSKKSITKSIELYDYSLAAGLGSDGLLGQMAGMIFGTDRYSYQMQLWEKTLGLVGIDPPGDNLGGNIMTTVLSVLNMAYAHGKSPIFLGGNAFQVLGYLNKEGFTDKSNVAPTRLEDLVMSNLANLVLRFIPQSFKQTQAGGMSDWNNPRNLEYQGKKGQTGARKVKRPGLGHWGNLKEDSGVYDSSNAVNSEKDYNVGRYNHLPGENLGAMLSAFGLGGDGEETEYYEKSATDPNETHTSQIQTSMGSTNDGALGQTLDGKAFDHFGDLHTMLPIKSGTDLDTTYPDSKPDDKKWGYPLYFKDLRDDTYIFFRGYIEGLTENVAPSWGEEQYIGRNEPVYHYERTTRDITFTLKLMAGNRAELDMIYGKMEKLTSLAYPRIHKDEINFKNMGKLRFIPPLCLFRLGDLYGQKDDEMHGFIRSINYSYPDVTTWEHTQNNRVPKHITAAISFQVLHTSAPNMLTKFYGKDMKNIGDIHNVEDAEKVGTDYNGFPGS